jgi:leucyl/phenylalanyl-tRNA---protein transferase
MPVYRLPEAVVFPPVDRAAKSGLLAVGGDLSPERLLAAYREGIFPWYGDGEPILWWSPDPRFVLFPNELRVSRSMRQFLKKRIVRITFDRAFREVISACRRSRPGQDGTWITEEMREAYCALNDLGFAHSVEVWREEELVGGL